MYTFKPGAHSRGRTRAWHRVIAGTTAVAIGATLSLAAVGTAGASTKLVTHLGNGTKGKLVAQANALASKLVGAKGTGLTRGVTSTSVKIGCVLQAAAFAGMQTGVEAAFNVINKKGGIYGRKLTLVTCKNTNNSVQTNVSDNQALVSQTQVFAILTLAQDELPSSTNYLNQHQVPYTGWGFDPGFCGTRWGFGWNGDLCGNSSTLPLEAIAGNLTEAIIKASGLPDKTVRFAVQGVAGPSGKIGTEQYDAEITALGGKVVYSGTNYPTTATGVDNTPYIQAMIAAKPNIVYLSTPFTDVGPLAAGLKAAGYTGIIMDFTNYIPGLLAESAQLAAALQGEYINTQVVPSEQTGTYTKLIAKDLGLIGKQPFVTLGAYMGFSEATMMAEMIKAAGKNLNTKTFTEAVNGSKGFTAYKTVPADGPGKITFPAAHYLPADCASIVQVTKTTYKVITPFSCYTSFKVTKKG